MIDRFTVLFSTAMTLYIVFRAAKLDRILPWFETKWLYEQAKKKIDDVRGAAARKKATTAGTPFGTRSDLVRR